MLARSLTLLLLAGSIQSAHAVGIGKVTLLSALGEPLHAQVDLQLGRGENIEDSCLSLSAADEVAGGNLDRLSLSDLSAKLDLTKRKVEIVSRKTFIEPFAVFRLRIKCADTGGSVSKTLTLLPEPAAAPVPVEPVVIRTSPLAQATLTETPLVIEPPVAIPAPATAPQQEHVPSAVPAQKKTVRKHTSAAPQERSAGFRLKVSGEPLDLTRIGKLSAEDREIVLAQQKLLDEDDQTARFLAMQNQVRVMQEELIAIRAKLANMEKNASSVPPAHPVAISTSEPVAEAQNWRNATLLAGLVAALLFTWLGLRRSARTRALARAHETTEPLVLPDEPPAQQPDIAAYSPFAQAGTTLARPLSDINATPTEPIREEEAAVLEEAELYAVHGHPDKASAILKEFVAQHPEREKAWVLLLSIYSSHQQVGEFDNAARAFLRHHQDSPSWRTIQAQGRTLDKTNPLYVDESEHSATTPTLSSLAQPKHRPIGDILIELGHLSLQDMENCLQDFDPKRHGRFGNYLVTRKQISHAQLNEALLNQYSGEATTRQRAYVPEDAPAPQEAVAPKTETEHVEDTAEQLMAPIALAPEETTPQADVPPPKSDAPLEFVIHLDLDKPAPAPQSEPANIDTSIPLEFDPNLMPKGNESKSD